MVYEGENYTGKWGGQFFGNDDDDTIPPGSVAGTFGAATSDGANSVLGVYGAGSPTPVPEQLSPHNTHQIITQSLGKGVLARPFPYSMSRAAAVFTFAVIVVLFSAVAPAGTDRPHLSSDPLVNSARTLIENGNFDEALSILRPLAPNHPDRTDVLFLLGLAAMRASEQAGIGKAAKTALLNESITAFHTILIRQPGLVRVRLELAQAFFLKGEDVIVAPSSSNAFWPAGLRQRWLPISNGF